MLALGRSALATSSRMVARATGARVMGGHAHAAPAVGSKPPKMSETTVHVTFVDQENKRVRVPGQIGQTVLEVAKEHGVHIDGACGGAMQCVSCHVHATNETVAAYPPMSTEESIRIQKALFLQPNSRLCCGMILSADIPETVVAIPVVEPTEVP